ncbi:major facilitator superfamily domain-containing protein [Elsinoe ampelina]|uniref:Major facilitator superfamily domain-containing protein n=1 Tax=Elsinoe ampelina TaxID=302913 RepID=A0A6A6G0R9_9PEZI|nr:major facilitator superfamily domain-containing protein [Elsinoe ampelina]
MSPQLPTIANVQVPDFIDERTPLIAAEAVAGLKDAQAEAILAKGPSTHTVPADAPPAAADDDDDTPLPKGQILILCYARMVEPIAFFSIFPFVNKMIYLTGLPESSVGFYSGLIESLFSLTQMALMLFWGRLSDRYGRRPVLIVSILGIAVGMTLFGFATDVWQMIAFRCLAGVFAGSLVAVRAMFSEVSTKKTQARAFSFFAVAGNFGIFIGPFIGGGLAEPVEQYPGLFGGNELFRKYPYALATMVSGAFAVSAAVLCAVGLKETLGGKAGGKKAEPMSTKELLKSPGVGWTLFLYGWNTMVALGYTAVAPVFWFTSPELGGYGLSPIQISMFLALAGASQALWTLFVFPPFQKRMGTGGVLKVCYSYNSFIYLMLPINSILRRNGKEVEFWVFAIIAALAGSSMSMTFTGIQLALNDVAPSHQTLGTLNALALTLVSGIRAIAPAGFASLFAFGVGHKILGGYFIWIIIITLAASLSIFVRKLPERAYGRPVKKKTAEVTEEESG